MLCMHTIFFLGIALSFYIDMNNEFEKIPEIFHSFESKKPFSHCLQCSRLLDDKTDYVIEKAMKRYPGYEATDTLFDYAMCMSCAFEMRNELSIDSRKTMDSFFQPHFEKLQKQSIDTKVKSVAELLSSCLITNQKIEEIGEFQVYAFCRGNKINRSIPPYMISESAIELVLPLISAETTNFLNGFFDKHFSPDPSILEPIRPKLILV